MPGTVNWGTATVVGVFAGMLYGGSKEASASVVSVSSYNIVQFQKHLSVVYGNWREFIQLGLLYFFLSPFVEF